MAIAYPIKVEVVSKRLKLRSIISWKRIPLDKKYSWNLQNFPSRFQKVDNTKLKNWISFFGFTLCSSFWLKEITPFPFLFIILMLLCFFVKLVQKQPSGGVHRKRCSENMQQIYRRAPMPKCDGCSPVNLLHIFSTPFIKNTSGWLLLLVLWVLGTYSLVKDIKFNYLLNF